MMNPKEYLVSAEEMQRYDSNTISEFKVPALILMEQELRNLFQNLQLQYNFRHQFYSKFLIHLSKVGSIRVVQSQNQENERESLGLPPD